MAQEDKRAQKNSMGDIINNRGIVTQGQIGNNTIINPIRRDPNGIYQGDNKIGSASAPVIQDGYAIFQGIRLSEYPDQTRPLEYGNLLLSAEGTPQPRPNTFVGTLSIVIAGFRAKILGERH